MEMLNSEILRVFGSVEKSEVDSKPFEFKADVVFDTTLSLNILEPFDVIDWGDGTINNSTSHTYQSTSIVTVKVYPAGNSRINLTFPSASKSYISGIVNWGNLFIKNQLFEFCQKFTSTDPIGDIPKFVDTNLVQVFSDSNFKQDISNWGPAIANVTNISGMFNNCRYPHDLTPWGPYTGNIIRATNFMYGSIAVTVPDFSQWTLNKNIYLGTLARNPNNYTPAKYDAVLQNFAESFIGVGRTENKTVTLMGFQYTDVGEVYRDQLIADGWTIQGDSKYQG